jgi:hypothetical protein
MVTVRHLGGCPDDGKSASGYLFKVNSGIVSWSSKKYTATTLSSAEAHILLSFMLSKNQFGYGVCFGILDLYNVILRLATRTISHSLPLQRIA